MEKKREREREEKKKGGGSAHASKTGQVWPTVPCEAAKSGYFVGTFTSHGGIVGSASLLRRWVIMCWTFTLYLGHIEGKDAGIFEATCMVIYTRYISEKCNEVNVSRVAKLMTRTYLGREAAPTKKNKR